MKLLISLVMVPLLAAVTDDFNRSNGSLGASWTSVTGSWSVVSNKAAQSATFDAARSGYVAVWPGVNASLVQAIIGKPAANRTAGIVLGYANTSGAITYWVAYVRTLALQPDEIRLYRYQGSPTSGTFTQLGSTYRAEISDGASLRLSASGTTLTVAQWDGAAWATRVSATDVSYAAGLAGLRATDTAWFDDFSITAAAGSGSAPGSTTALQISDVTGLTDAIASKPTKAIGYLPSRAAVINANGEIDVATGDSGDCVKVNGTSGACGGGGGGGAGLGFDVTRATTTLTIGLGAARIGSNVYAFASPTVVTLASGDGTVRVYVTSDGGLAVAKTTGDTASLSCDGCSVAAAGSQFPIGSIPLYTWVASGGVWDTAFLADWRTALSAPPKFVAGENVTLTQTGDTLTIASTGGGAGAVTSGSTILNRQGPLSSVALSGTGYDTLFTYTLPGGTLGNNGCLRISFAITNSVFTVLRFAWGAKTFDTALGAAPNVRAELEICNANSATAQSILWPNAAGIWYNSGNAAGHGGVAYEEANENTANDVVIALKGSGSGGTLARSWWKVLQQ